MITNKAIKPMKKYETFKTDYTLQPKLTEREGSMRCMTRYTVMIS
ncbi:hypothetical protein [Variimorphobacter saccharofermentans]|nr:hypothetical protein [Variimorphobacter saccharofermentans]